MSRIQAHAAVEKHSIPPFFGSDSQILILGSFPSVKSRESGFYYGHPQNRFWRVLSSVFNAPLPQTIDQKQEFLRTHYIALWDVAAECSIRGSADSSISAVTANDIAPLLRSTQIKAVFLNGQTAQKLFRKYLSEETAKSIRAGRIFFQNRWNSESSHTDALMQTHHIHSKNLLPNGAAQSAPSL